MRSPSFCYFGGKRYGNRITVTRGDVHDYLGMDLDFSTKGTVKVSMIKYRKKIFEAFPEKITSAAATPAADHLFEVRDDEERKPPPEEQARAFHHSVAQLLFLSGRQRATRYQDRSGLFDNSSKSSRRGRLG